MANALDRLLVMADMESKKKSEKGPFETGVDDDITKVNSELFT